MAAGGGVGGVGVIALVLGGGVGAMGFPPRVMRLLRLSALFYRGTWWLWREASRAWPAGWRREAFLSLYGPLSLLGLLATWVCSLILGFALVYHSLGVDIHAPEGAAQFGTYLYFSGVTFFTLGYGDVVPTTHAARALAVAQAGLGFGFMAVII